MLPLFSDAIAIAVVGWRDYAQQSTQVGGCGCRKEGDEVWLGGGIFGDGSQGHGEHCCSGRKDGKRMMMTMSMTTIQEVVTASMTILPHLLETTISHSAMALAKRGGV